MITNVPEPKLLNCDSFPCVEMLRRFSVNEYTEAEGHLVVMLAPAIMLFETMRPHEDDYFYKAASTVSALLETRINMLSCFEVDYLTGLVHEYKSNGSSKLIKGTVPEDFGFIFVMSGLCLLKAQALVTNFPDKKSLAKGFFKNDIIVAQQMRDAFDLILRHISHVLIPEDAVHEDLVKRATSSWSDGLHKFIIKEYITYNLSDPDAAKKYFCTEIKARGEKILLSGTIAGYFAKDIKKNPKKYLKYINVRLKKEPDKSEDYIYGNFSSYDQLKRNIKIWIKSYRKDLLSIRQAKSNS